MAIILPSGKTKATAVNPKRLVLYSKPKAGKTTLLANLPDSLLIDLEDGSDYVDAVKVKIRTLSELKELGQQIIAAGKPYKRGILDTVTALEDMVMPLAKQLYMKTPKQTLGLIIVIL